MDHSLHWYVGESQHAVNRIYEIDRGLTNLETLLNHGFVLWTQGDKIQYDAPKELKASSRDTQKAILTTQKQYIFPIISDPDSIRKALSDAQWAIAELFNHSNILEEELERLSEAVKKRNNNK